MIDTGDIPQPPGVQTEGPSPVTTVAAPPPEQRQKVDPLLFVRRPNASEREHDAQTPEGEAAPQQETGFTQRTRAEMTTFLTQYAYNLHEAARRPGGKKLLDAQPHSKDMLALLDIDKAKNITEKDLRGKVENLLDTGNGEAWVLGRLVLEQETSLQMFGLGLATSAELAEQNIDPQALMRARDKTPSRLSKLRNWIAGNKDAAGAIGGIAGGLSTTAAAEAIRSGAATEALINSVQFLAQHPPDLLTAVGIAGVAGGAALATRLGKHEEIPPSNPFKDYGPALLSLQRDPTLARYLKETVGIDVSDYRVDETTGAIRRSETPKSTYNLRNMLSGINANLQTREHYFDDLGFPKEGRNRLAESFLAENAPGQHERLGERIQTEILRRYEALGGTQDEWGNSEDSPFFRRCAPDMPLDPETFFIDREGREPHDEQWGARSDERESHHRRYGRKGEKPHRSTTVFLARDKEGRTPADMRFGITDDAILAQIDSLPGVNREKHFRPETGRDEWGQTEENPFFCRANGAEFHKHINSDTIVIDAWGQARTNPDGTPNPFFGRANSTETPGQLDTTGNLERYRHAREMVIHDLGQEFLQERIHQPEQAISQLDQQITNRGEGGKILEARQADQHRELALLSETHTSLNRRLQAMEEYEHIQEALDKNRQELDTYLTETFSPAHEAPDAIREQIHQTLTGDQPFTIQDETILPIRQQRNQEEDLYGMARAAYEQETSSAQRDVLQKKRAREDQVYNRNNGKRRNTAGDLIDDKGKTFKMRADEEKETEIAISRIRENYELAKKENADEARKKLHEIEERHTKQLGEINEKATRLSTIAAEIEEKQGAIQENEHNLDIFSGADLPKERHMALYGAPIPTEAQRLDGIAQTLADDTELGDIRMQPPSEILRRINSLEEGAGWPEDQNDDPINKERLAHVMVLTRARQISAESAESIVAWQNNIDTMNLQSLYEAGISYEAIENLTPEELQRLMAEKVPQQSRLSPENIELAQRTLKNYRETMKLATFDVREGLTRQGTALARELESINLNDEIATLEVTRDLLQRTGSISGQVEDIMSDAEDRFSAETLAEVSNKTKRDKGFTEAEIKYGEDNPDTPLAYYEMLDVLFDYRNRPDRQEYFARISNEVSPNLLMEVLSEYKGTAQPPLEGNDLKTLATSIKENILNSRLSQAHIREMFMGVLDEMRFRAQKMG